MSLPPSFGSNDLTVPFVLPSLDGRRTIRQAASAVEVDVGNVLTCVRVVVGEGWGKVARGGEGREVMKGKHCYPYALIDGRTRPRRDRAAHHRHHHHHPHSGSSGGGGVACRPRNADGGGGQEEKGHKGYYDLGRAMDALAVSAADGTRSEEELEDILGMGREEIRKAVEREGGEYCRVYI